MAVSNPRIIPTASSQWCRKTPTSPCDGSFCVQRARYGGLEAYAIISYAHTPPKCLGMISLSLMYATIPVERRKDITESKSTAYFVSYDGARLYVGYARGVVASFSIPKQEFLQAFCVNVTPRLIRELPDEPGAFLYADRSRLYLRRLGLLPPAFPVSLPGVSRIDPRLVPGDKREERKKKLNEMGFLPSLIALNPSNTKAALFFGPRAKKYPGLPPESPLSMFGVVYDLCTKQIVRYLKASEKFDVFDHVDFANDDQILGRLRGHPEGTAIEWLSKTVEAKVLAMFVAEWYTWNNDSTRRLPHREDEPRGGLSEAVLKRVMEFQCGCA